MQVHAKEAMPPGLSHFYVVCPPEQKLAVLRALVRRELGVSSSSSSSASLPSPLGAPATTSAATSASGAGAGAGAQGNQPLSSRVGVSSSDGGGGKADNRGLVFALATKPLEAIAGSLDKALGGGRGGVGVDATGKLEQQAKGKGGTPAPPPLAEFLREELGLNARVRREAGGRPRCCFFTDALAEYLRCDKSFCRCR